MANAAPAAGGLDALQEAAPPFGARPPDAADDDSDWEYEYSTTETETHLITLDLSLPEFLRRRKEHIMHNTRGGFRSWMNPIMNNDHAPPFSAPDTPRRPSVHPSTRAHGEDEEAEGGEGGQVREEQEGQRGHSNDDDDDDADDRIGPRPGGGSTQDAADKLDDLDGDDDDDDDDILPAEIQILDLHCAKPMFSYRGVVLRGTWTEPIGTELLFTDGGGSGDGDGGGGRGSGTRTDGVQLPALPIPSLAVDGDVALLGASTARILCTPAELRPRPTIPTMTTLPTRFAADNSEVSTGDAATTSAASKKRRVGFAIPVATNASAQRQKQAAFLEQLMAVKHRFGEDDVVTVQALETTQDAVPAGDDEEALRRAKRQVQAERDHRRVLARRERERELRDRRERKVQQAQQRQDNTGGGGGGGDSNSREAPVLAPAPAGTPTASPSGRRRRGRMEVDRVVGDGFYLLGAGSGEGSAAAANMDGTSSQRDTQMQNGP